MEFYHLRHEVKKANQKMDSVLINPRTEVHPSLHCVKSSSFHDANASMRRYSEKRTNPDENAGGVYFHTS